MLKLAPFLLLFLFILNSAFGEDLSKLPPQFQSSSSLTVLGLNDETSITETMLRRAAGKLLSKYSFDKNPNGFEGLTQDELSLVQRIIWDARKTALRFLKLKKDSGQGDSISKEDMFAYSPNTSSVSQESQTTYDWGNIPPNQLVPMGYYESLNGTIFSELLSVPEVIIFAFETNSLDIRSSKTGFIVFRASQFPKMEIVLLNSDSTLAHREELRYARRYHRSGTGAAFDALLLPDGSYFIFKAHFYFSVSNKLPIHGQLAAQAIPFGIPMLVKFSKTNTAANLNSFYPVALNTTQSPLNNVSILNIVGPSNTPLTIQNFFSPAVEKIPVGPNPLLSIYSENTQPILLGYTPVKKKFTAMFDHKPRGRVEIENAREAIRILNLVLTPNIELVETQGFPQVLFPKPVIGATKQTQIANAVISVAKQIFGSNSDQLKTIFLKISESDESSVDKIIKQVLQTEAFDCDSLL